MEAGGGSGAKNEGRLAGLTQKWRISVVKSEIYRSAGVRSDPVASRRFRIFCLFGVFGVACQVGSWRRVVPKMKGGWGD